MSVYIRKALDDLIEKYRPLLEEKPPTEQMRREHAHPQRLDMRAINIHLAPEDVAKVEAMAETKDVSSTASPPRSSCSTTTALRVMVQRFSIRIDSAIRRLLVESPQCVMVPVDCSRGSV